MNGLFWVLLLCCCGKKRSCGSVNACNSSVGKRGCYEEKASCSLEEREKVWSPYMGNGLNHDEECGCDHTH